MVVSPDNVISGELNTVPGFKLDFQNAVDACFRRVNQRLYEITDAEVKVMKCKTIG